jgi:hypothetical protein
MQLMWLSIFASSTTWRVPARLDHIIHWYMYVAEVPALLQKMTMMSHKCWHANCLFVKVACFVYGGAWCGQYCWISSSYQNDSFAGECVFLFFCHSITVRKI